jgi:drug/metabolite transporter (DMT)-like permease
MVCFFWGTTYLAIRVGVATFPPALFAGTRFTIAGLVFLAFLKLRGYRLPPWREAVDQAVVGIALLAVANGTVVWCEQWVPSGITALIVATVPFWMSGFDALMPAGDRLTPRKMLGIIIGFSGLVLLLWPDLRNGLEPSYLRGVLVLLIAPLAWAAGSMYSRYRKTTTHPLMAAAIQTLVAGLVLMFIGTALGEFKGLTVTGPALAAIAYLIVFGSIVGYTCYIYALGALPVSFVSMFAYINPVIAVLLGWLILDERLDFYVVTATAIILAGVLLVQTASSAPETRKPRS